MMELYCGAPPVGAERVEVVSLVGGEAQPRTDWVADEVPIALVVNGIAHAVMLATPHDIEDFARGFALTEGLLEQRSELHGIDVVSVELGIEVHLEVSSACAWRLRDKRRALAGRTGCGICGAEQLEQVRRALPMAPPVQVLASAIAHAQRDMHRHQRLQQLTGAAHAAAWCSLDGTLQLLREDVGRHNALDKLVGALSKASVQTADGFACITSRASFEMVQKAAAAGIGALAAVSAPTHMAVVVARELGVVLTGFVRGDSAVAYTYPERILLS